MEPSEQNPVQEKNYKYKDLRTYSSDEWMANATKIYRKVFDRAETTFMRCELSFYNKLFDRDNWNCVVIFKCFDLEDGKRREMCALENQCEVKKEDNIVYVRDGWGHSEEGAFWVQGNYYWEAYIDGELVGELKFVVNDVAKVTTGNNPYFDVEYIKLHVGDFDAFESTDRRYLKKIKQETTQYVWVEARLRNKLNVDWNYELFFSFFDNTYKLKGHLVREGKIHGGKLDYNYTFDVGWGNGSPGSWKNKKYKVALIFMDVVVAEVEFECGDTEEEGIPHLVIPSSNEAVLPRILRTIFPAHKGGRG